MKLVLTIFAAQTGQWCEPAEYFFWLIEEVMDLIRLQISKKVLYSCHPTSHAQISINLWLKRLQHVKEVSSHLARFKHLSASSLTSGFLLPWMTWSSKEGPNAFASTLCPNYSCF